jgi:hypothetical protein
MKELLKPTSLVLVGILLILVYLGSSVGQPYLDGSEPRTDLKDSNYDLLHHQKGSDLGKLKLSGNTVYFPWASRRGHGISPPLFASRPSNEKVLLDSSVSRARVQDLSAINSAKQRDLIYRDSQNKGPKDQSLANSLDISVKGGENNAGDEHSATLESRDVEQPFAGYGAKSGVNFLNVEVSGITINAINTMEGGSAVATSNIIIEPVQTIVYATEVEAKLR